ncbi:SMI1/KNR4 family protein [Paenibacillus durus]|uniref:SMI1/KNR4 family protein n=1 Tax=Paenibacillus durus TaxID=44251 RepID=UPI0012DFE968
MSKSRSLHIQRSLGYERGSTFAFYKPASNREFKDFPTATGLTLPDDFQYFLTQHNGAELFRDEETYDPSWFIFGLDEIAPLVAA